MSKLSAEQIARHAREAGFSGDGLTTAVAVALAESGGDPRAHNSTPPDNSYGLWQINMLGAMGPERRRQFGLDSNAELFDPEVNARAANKISGDGRSFTPWSTYTNGAYKKYLDDARRATRAKPGGGSSGGERGPGYTVDPELVAGYVKRTRRLSDELATTGKEHLRGVREIADDSFGRIGKESGFAAALDGFSAALHRQVRGISAGADALADRTAEAAKAYRDQEDDTARRLGRKAP
ncbi:transglycosylase SLT domain-containing protein [Amycolatopsis magusensis]|uniref:transglycosylase SLT domain-containing protein n=1 Tax=Amycolatopsis magusensis TaxID=882444 RepID=UPI0037A0775A